MTALVTRLREEFTDNNLPKIDEIQIKVVNNAPNEIMNIYINSISGKGCYARTTGDVSLCNETGLEDYGDYKILSSEIRVFFKGTKGSVFIGNKGNAGGISLYSEKTKVDISDLNYLAYNNSSIYTITSNDKNCIYGNVSEFILVKDIIGSLNFQYCTDLYGDVTDVLKQGKKIGSILLAFSTVKFDLIGLSYQKSISASIYCNGVRGDIKYAVYNKRKVNGTENIEFNVNNGSFLNIYGSIEELVSLGVSTIGSGSIKLYHLKNMPNVTYQGVSVAESSAIPSISPILSWDDTGNISWS